MPGENRHTEHLYYIIEQMSSSRICNGLARFVAVYISILPKPVLYIALMRTILPFRITIHLKNLPTMQAMFCPYHMMFHQIPV